MSYINDRDVLPAGKADARPLSGPANLNLTGAEWNTVVSAIDELRRELAKAYAKYDLTVYVNSITGTNDPKDIFNGDYADHPYATLAGLISDMPRNLAGHTLTVKLPLTDVPATTVSGFTAGEVVLQGQMALATGLASGVNTGAAGAGTTTTSVVKPGAAANWTANNLVGKFLLYSVPLPSLDGTIEYVRPIKANTTTTITIDALPGMAAGETFSIVTAGSLLSEAPLTISKNSADVTVRHVGFTSSGLDYQVLCQGNETLTFDGCTFSGTSVFEDVNISRAAKVKFENCIFRNAVQVQYVSEQVELANCYHEGAYAFEVLNVGDLTVSNMLSTDALSNAIRVVGADSANISATANSGDASAFYLESINAATLDLHGSANTGYGVEMAKSGRYTLTGSDVTGSDGDFTLMGNEDTWSNLSNPAYGIAEEHSGSAVANSGYTKALVYGNRLFYGNIDVSGRTLEYGYHNFSQATGLTATGTNQATAYQLGAHGFNRVDTTAAGTGVKLPAGAALPGVLCIVKNSGANILKVYSSAVAGTIDGGASVDVGSGATKIFVSSSDDGLSWTTL